MNEYNKFHCLQSENRRIKMIHPPNTATYPKVIKLTKDFISINQQIYRSNRIVKALTRTAKGFPSSNSIEKTAPISVQQFLFLCISRPTKQHIMLGFSFKIYSTFEFRSDSNLYGI